MRPNYHQGTARVAKGALFCKDEVEGLQDLEVDKFADDRNSLLVWFARYIFSDLLVFLESHWKVTGISRFSGCLLMFSEQICRNIYTFIYLPRAHIP